MNAFIPMPVRGASRSDAKQIEAKRLEIPNQNTESNDILSRIDKQKKKQE